MTKKTLKEIHFGGESKEVIQAEDDWHNSQMTYTEKRLEEFDKNFASEVILDQEVRTVLSGLKLFVAESIQQAIAEERSKAWEGEAVKQAYIQGKSHAEQEMIKKVEEYHPKHLGEAGGICVYCAAKDILYSLDTNKE